jgi:hypothetical protein
LSAAVTVTVPLLEVPVVLACAVRVITPAPLPFIGDAVSHAALLLTVQLLDVKIEIVERVPPPDGAVHAEVLQLKEGPGSDACVTVTSLDML